MKQWNSNGGTVGGHSGTVRWDSGTAMVNFVVEQWNIDGETVWSNSRTVMVEQCGGKVEHSWWKSVVEQWNSHGGTV